MIPARFYDGQTAGSKEVTVSNLGGRLEITLLDTQERITVQIDELQVAKGRDLIVVSFDDRALEFWPLDWADLKISAKDTKRTRAALKIVPISLSILAIIVIFHKQIVTTLANLLPDNYLDHTSKMLVTSFEKDRCLKADPAMQEIFGRLGENYSDYKVLVVRSSILNAFALPGKVVIITSELLKFVTSPEALTGIVAHEIIHIKERHVHRMYVAQILVDSFWQLTLGQGIGVPLNELAKGYFSQGEEREADVMAAQMLKDQGISPTGMQDFFRDLEKKESTIEKYLGISHPAYPDRIQVFDEKYDTTPVMGPELWKELLEACNDLK